MVDGVCREDDLRPRRLPKELCQAGGLDCLTVEKVGQHAPRSHSRGLPDVSAYIVPIATASQITNMTANTA